MEFIRDINIATSRPDGLPLHGDTFVYALCDTPTVIGDAGYVHMALATFNHQDPDFTFDPLSTNRRLHPSADLAVLGKVVVAGPTSESIQVLVPDCTVPPVGNDVQIAL